MKAPPIWRMLEVNRAKMKVTLRERPDDSYRFKNIQQWECAIGMKGYATPAGLYLINSKVKDPDWLVPDSQWAIDAGLIPGTIVPGGEPNNPIRERWLGITDPEDGIGIHGTDAYWSIGTRASHGCVRLLPEDVIDLYSQVQLYTPIVIL